MSPGRLTPAAQAEVAEWLHWARSDVESPIPAYDGRPLPLEAVYLAYNRGLMGVTARDRHRLLTEAAARIRPPARTGPPDPAEAHRRAEQ
jgi:hypothetical protein